MLSTIWNTVFYNPILNVMLLLYSLFGNNLGLAIIVLTLLLRLVLFPLTRSQLESSAKVRQLQPQLEALKKKYPKNPQKLQEEQVKLYRKVGYNPLGCLVSTLLPFPFLIAIYQAITAFSNANVQGIYPFVMDFLNLAEPISVNTHFLFWDLSQSYMPLAKEHGYFVLWILPYLALALLTGVSQYISVKVMTPAQDPNVAKKPEKSKELEKKKDKKKDEAPDMSNMMKDMNKSMSLTFPLMTAFIALSIPSAVSIYWIVQSLTSAGLQVLYMKLRNKGKYKPSKSKTKLNLKEKDVKVSRKEGN